MPSSSGGTKGDRPTVGEMSPEPLTPIRHWKERRALAAARRRADAELLSTALASPRLAWRTEELVAEDYRIGLGRSLTDVVHSADERLLPGASPLNRGSVRERRAELLELAARLCDLSRPVAPRGVLLVDRLLSDGSGPLYGRRPAAQLLLATERARAALDGGDVSAR
jgi:hypothetical protein